MELTDKVAIVTGASSGIGAALTRLLLACGTQVALAARREDRLNAVLASSTNPDRGLVVPTDVTEHHALASLVDRTLDQFGQIDVLVNNAGDGLTATMQDHTPEEIAYLVTVNLIAPLWLTRLALPAILDRPEGLVVNVSSMSALTRLPLQAPYVAAKSGLRGFAKALRRDLLETNVRVLTVFPGTVDTEMTAASRDQLEELRIPVHPAEFAAERIYRAMRGRRREAIIGGFPERLLAALDAVAPWLLDRPLQRLRPKLEAMAAISNRHARARFSISGPIEKNLAPSPAPPGSNSS
ncbi:MAG: SDR family oxidoreductase [Deltaproteobacteria bacterium]|nr:SDR family oxidoreductase [Deltaproteobacteria bacterium]